MTDAGAGKVRSAIDIMEEAVHVLKKDPFLLVPYYIGSLPFVLGLVYFWTEMSTGSSAWRYSSQAAWGLSLLFLWMKVWQTVYARDFLSGLRGAGPASWNAGRILRALVAQTAIQPWGIIALPAALAAVIPFPRVFAFFQNATLLGNGNDRDLGVVLRKSWQQSGLWRVQNTLLVWLGSPILVVFAAFLLFAIVPAVTPLVPETSRLVLLLLLPGFAMIALSPLAVIVALNLGIFMFLAPHLLQVLLGIETALSRSNAWVTNDTFFVVLCGLVYLCLDPFIKACYCLRCFYGISLRTGEDLKVEMKGLKSYGPIVLLIFALLLGAGLPAHAWAGPAPLPQRASISPAELDAALDRTIHLPQYEWRMPREKPPVSAPHKGALSAFLAPVVRGLRAAWDFCAMIVSKTLAFLVDLLFRITPVPRHEKTPGWTSLSRALIIAPLLCLAAVFGFVGWRAWKMRKSSADSEGIGVQPVPDITGEEVDAAALPEDGWLEMARALTERGESRYAIRALHLATLAFLARRRFITLERHKSDREYEKELLRRSQVDPRLAPLFTENRGLFERTWYGLHEATPGLVERFRLNHERIREHDQP
jgi:hypothetical protein